MALFKRRLRPVAGDTPGLGRDVIAVRLAAVATGADTVPAGAVIVIVDAGGRARRSLSVKAVDGVDEAVYCFHPGPYGIDLIPFAGAPELGLRLSFVVDAADPRVTQQRFDLFLHSEAEVGVDAPLTLGRFGALLEATLQRELAQGNLDLAPCTSHDEWNLFRAGLNQLLYTRFGVTVEDCLPADFGDRVDFSAVLASRMIDVGGFAGVAGAVDGASAMPAPAAAPERTPPLLSVPVEAVGVIGETRETRETREISGTADARALRRLFLELPALSGALRLAGLPAGQPWFQLQQRLLQRLDLAAIEVATMPSLAWQTPDRRLDAGQQARRAAASVDAVRTLDDAWALLARLQRADGADLPALLDDADRLLCNLACALALRRAAFVALAGDDEDGIMQERREPT